MEKDIIVGVVDNYTWDQIKHWANSIKESGFEGYKAVFAYNMNADTVRKLTAEGFMVIGANTYTEENGFTFDANGQSLMVNRFIHLHQFLDNIDVESIRYVIATDVRDVVFQVNPSLWLESELVGEELVVGSENLLYKDEPWNANNMVQSFGRYFYDKVVNRQIYCAGVLAGKLETFKDFCLNLWLLCNGRVQFVPGGGGPDQAALNILLNTSYVKDVTYRSNPSDLWVLHAGTTLPAIEAGSGGIGEAYKAGLWKPEEKFVKEYDVKLDDEGFVIVDDQRVAIVHQWDRVPAWKETFTKKYEDK